MRNMRACITAVGLILILFLLYERADAIEARVMPSKISPGDGFMITLRRVTAHNVPSAVLSGKTLLFSACGKGCFIALGAVAMETEPRIHSITVNVGEKRVRLNLAVKHKGFPTIFLTLPESKVSLSPEDLSRAQKEREKLQSIWQTVSGRLWDGPFIRPLDNDTSTAFGTKRIMNRKKTSVHRGMDIRGAMGEAVKATNQGRVVLSEELFFGGNTVILDHGLGIYSIYMHLSKSDVVPGGIVSKGDVIGLVGSSGRATGPHLHFGMKVQNINANPASLMELLL